MSKITVTFEIDSADQPILKDLLTDAINRAQKRSFAAQTRRTILKYQTWAQLARMVNRALWRDNDL